MFMGRRGRKYKDILIIGGFYFGVLCVLVRAAVAHGSTIDNTAVFENNGALTASALAATIAASQVSFQPLSPAAYEGNTVGAGAFNGAFGIIAVNQNTGINAISQQTVTVKADSITLTAH